MFQPSRNPYKVHGRQYLLLEKRNKQFSDLFARLRDPFTIIQFYELMHPIFDKYFGSMNNAEKMVNVLIWANETNRTHFFHDELCEKFNIGPTAANGILVKLDYRDLITVEKGRQPFLYRINHNGKLYLKNFAKEINTVMMQVIKNGRKGKKKATLKKSGSKSKSK